MSRFGYELPFGAQLIAPERTRFRFWAPDCEQVRLVLGETTALPMAPEADGWFVLACDCGAGTRYQFELPSGQRVPDPASRWQPDGVHGASVVIDPHDYQWQQDSWQGRRWSDMVIYELHVGCFSESHDFDGVRRHLQELADLGVTAIELMPIAAFPGNCNWGYDGVLPFAPAATYGSPAQLKRLIDCAHALGLCVYLDVVYNHFGPDGNHLHSYAEAFFDADKHSPWGAAIDFSRPEVRQFFTTNALYWLLEYRFDGLRFDAVHAISDPGWLDEMAAEVRRAIEPGRQVHLVLENEHNASGHLEQLFDAQWNDDGHNVLHVMLTGESEGYYANYTDQPSQKLARCLAEGFVYQGEWSPTHDHTRGTRSGHLPAHAFVLFLQNHDQIGNRALGERLTTLTSERALRAATTLQLLAPQIPLLFMGEEWGCTQPFLFFTDFHNELADAVRNGRRNEFAAFAAFQDEASRAQIPDPNAPGTFTCSVLQRPAALHTHPVWCFYQKLLYLRREHIAPELERVSDAWAEVLAEGVVHASWQLETERLHIAANLSDRNVTVPVPRGIMLFESDVSHSDEIDRGALLAWTTWVWLEPTARM